MQSEQFDKKVKDAADHHHPAYDEQAWRRMEKLLDKHLPQKEENRKRFIFFILLFLGTGLGAWLLISKPWQHDKAIVSNNPVVKETNTTVPANSNSGDNNKPIQEDNTITGQENTTIPTITSNEDKTVNSPVNTLNNQPGSVVLDPQKDRSFKERKDQTSFSVLASKTKRKSTSDNNNNNVQPVKELPTVQSPVAIVAELPSKTNEPLAKENPVGPTQTKEVAVEKTEPKTEAVIAKTDTPEKKETNSKKTTNKNKKSNSFFFTLSAGPDLSFVGSGNSSQVKLLAGGGVGFTYKEKFTLRTGFYTGRKVYSAKPSDYKAPPDFYTIYPYLEKVDANCKVYEIPVALSYNFGKKSQWFVSAGLSSFLMKEESYNYFYKYTATGNTYTRRWTIKDENKHYFSVGTLSAGYKQAIGKRVTVMAEPYIKLPFAGVGYGKVKLNSGGVLFTVGIKAF